MSAATAANVALSSSLGKGGIKICEEFFDLVVRVGGRIGDLDESPLDDLVAVRGGGSQLVEACIELFV